jgi:hypothetical protein
LLLFFGVVGAYMEFNVTLSLVGLNMSALSQGSQNDHQNDGLTFLSATMNLTGLSLEWIDFVGQPYPDPMNPGMALLMLRVRLPRMGMESPQSMVDRYMNYYYAFNDLPRYNKKLDDFAKEYHSELVSAVDISAVKVGGVTFVGDFMGPYPTDSPAMGPSNPPGPG